MIIKSRPAPRRFLPSEKVLGHNLLLQHPFNKKEFNLYDTTGDLFLENVYQGGAGFSTR